MLVLVKQKSQCARHSCTDNSKQVAVLVPTTLLAQQHFSKNFRDCFANLLIRVEVLSRFKSAKEQKRSA
ncbi:hypothetical protein OH492_19790 [Vibrio chagasii]|nr:hypothetical protein [Vibrio chagasii]